MTVRPSRSRSRLQFEAPHRAAARWRGCTYSLAAWAALLFGGCTTPDPNQVGELGKGTFSYGCVNSADSTCQVPEAVLPFVVAVGGRFNVKFTAKNGSAANVEVPIKTLVARRETGFEVLKAGIHPLVAIDGLGRAIDFRHVHGKEISEVRLGSDSDSSHESLQLDVGKTVTVGAFAFDDEQVQLRGSIAFVWTSGDALTIAAPGADGKVELKGLRAATTNITLTIGDKTFTVPVRIGDGGPLTGTQLDGSMPPFFDASALGIDAQVENETDGGAP